MVLLVPLPQHVITCRLSDRAQNAFEFWVSCQVAADKNTSIDFFHTEPIPDSQPDGDSGPHQHSRALSEAVIAIADSENCRMERLPVGEAINQNVSNPTSVSAVHPRPWTL